MKIRVPTAAAAIPPINALVLLAESDGVELSVMGGTK